jgi:signal transduction histidine kinase
MDGTTLVVAAIAGGAAAAIVGMWARARERRLRETLERATSALDEHDRARAETDAVMTVIDAAMEEGVMLFDAAGRLRYANEASERHLGKRPASVTQLFPAAAAEAAAAAASGEPRIVEAETASRWLRVAATPAAGGAVLVVVSDVTGPRRVEALRRDFVVNASHELKTPAASIRAAAEMLLDALRNDPGSVPRFARTLEQEAARLSRIVADLLDLSRLEAGGDLDGTVRLDAVAREEARRYADRAREARLAFEVRTERVPEIVGSERDLALMVGNLIDNAIRYTPEGGTVDVTVARSDDNVRLRVSDSGIGIPQRDLTRVLERFYRVDRGRSRRTGGTGLGLSIVRHVAENHSGSVSVSSELGRGTTVDVLLPASTSS